MCGIVAYSGQSESVLNSLVSGLKRLEYRGYDSAGVALITSDRIYSQKAVGKIVELEKAINAHQPNNVGTVGIAHTRWATHGPATVTNAHPHPSHDGKIWLVHNGIIENYRELKAELEAEGCVFTSETDTEVVAKLIGNIYAGDLRAAVLLATEKLKGAYALAVMCEDEPNRLIGVKMASPMVVGVADKELIIASDVSAIIDRTNKVIYMEDGELIDIAGTEYEILSFQNEPVTKAITEVDWDFEAATKQGYDHFLLKEIMEQPQVIQDSIRGRIMFDKADVKFGGLIDVEERLKTINRVVILGIGTSYYSAKLGELYFNALSGVPAQAAMSPEFRYTKNAIDKNTWVIAMSQSGETADTIAAIEEAQKAGALVTGIVNVVGSAVARMTDAGVYNHIGPEISVASTKAFTSQCLILLMHAIKLGKYHGLDYAQSKQLLEGIQALPDQIAQILKQHEDVETVAAEVSDSHSMLYIGRQYNYPIALEGALKLKELSYIHAEGLSGGELKHGFIAVVDANLYTLAIATEDTVQEKMMANIAEVKAREGRVIAVANEALPGVDACLIVPKAHVDMLQPLINNVALQLLAYYVAKGRGVDIDQPRNLAKSVTVE